MPVIPHRSPRRRAVHDRANHWAGSDGAARTDRREALPDPAAWRVLSVAVDCGVWEVRDERGVVSWAQTRTAAVRDACATGTGLGYGRIVVHDAKGTPAYTLFRADDGRWHLP